MNHPSTAPSAHIASGRPTDEPKPGGRLPDETPKTPTPGGERPGPRTPYPVDDPGIDDPAGPGSEPDYLPGAPTNPNTRY
jgi:hypothetical protein